MRITTSMIQRNVLANLNTLSTQLARTQAKAASGKEITRPSDDPLRTAQAMAMRQALGANEQFTRNIEDAQGWQDATEASLSAITDFLHRASYLLVQGSTDTLDPTARKTIASEIDQIVEGMKETANAKFGDKYLMSGTATSVAPYKPLSDEYQPVIAPMYTTDVNREIGPGVTMAINSVAGEILGDGRAVIPAGDGKLLSALRDIADHLRAGDGAALRGGDMTGLKTQLDSLLDVRARNGARTNRLEAATSRLDQVQETITKQLSVTEDADIARTMIDFNSQSAAYQASLRAGANIVQSSLMDFLR